MPIINKNFFWVPIILSALTAQVALAELMEKDSEEEDLNQVIVVTAQKRAGSLQDTPFSISAKTGKTLERLGATDNADYLKTVPGVSFQDTGPGTNQLTIRGASATPVRQDAPNYKEGVGIYLDESPIALALFNPDLDPYDIQRVEVLRGPQGTLFGSGSLSGTIRFITNKPDLERLYGKISSDFSSVSEGGTGYDVKGFLNIPLTDSTAIRIVGYQNDYAGFIDRISARSGNGSDIGIVKKDANTGSKAGGRFALSTGGDDFEIDLGIVYQKIEADALPTQDILVADIRGGGHFATPGDLEQIREFDEKNENEFLMVNVNISYYFENLDFVSATTYLERDIQNAVDFTQAFGGFLSDVNGTPFTNTLGLNDQTDAEGLTQEFRLVSNNSDDFEWIVGVFYQDQTRNYLQTAPSPNFDELSGFDVVAEFNSSVADSTFDLAIDVELKQLAIFGESTWSFAEQWDATLGLRWFDYDEKSSQMFTGFFNGGVIDSGTASTKESGVNPRFILNYTHSDAMSIAGQISKGFKLGGANAPLPGFCQDDLTSMGLGSEPDAFDSEDLLNYELSLKSSSADKSMSFNASAFYIDYEGVQLTAILPICQFGFIVNSGDASSRGVEMEANFYPVDGLELTVGYSYTDAQFESNFNGAALVGFGAISSGDRLPGSPQNTFSTSLYYEFSVNNNYKGYVHGNYQYVGGILTRANDILNPVLLKTTLDSSSIASLRAGILSKDKTWNVSLYVNNLFDERAEISLYEVGGGTGIQSLFRNRPRTIGLSVNYSF